MIDLFTLALTHGLIALAAIRLLTRAELDDEETSQERAASRPWLKQNRARRSMDDSGDA